jgi:GT2 family glycosyltransferase
MALTGRPLSVLVIAYGREDLLADALRPLSGHFPIVVIDNAQAPECEALCRSLGARYVDPGANLGFARGVNLGLRVVDTTHDVLLLNPDARIDPGDVKRLQAALHRDARASCAAPAQSHPVTAVPQRVGWPFPSPRREWLIALGLGRLLGHEDFLIGAILLLDRDALDDIGGFDERFFLYAEETDWQRRAVAAGWHGLPVPEIQATHVGAATSTDPHSQEAYFYAASEIYVRKWFGPRGWASYRAAVVAGAVPRMLVGGRTRRASALRRLKIMLRGPVRHRTAFLAGGGPR